MSESGSGEPVSPTGATDKEASVCPTCGRDDFDTVCGMKIHHRKAHGESIAGLPFDCDWCGKTTRKRPNSKNRDNHFCDSDCYGEWLAENKSGTNHPCWSGVLLECDWCGGRYPVSMGRADSSRYCSRDCKDDAQTELTGEDHPRWKGGAHKNYRGDWYEARKRRLEVDEYSCIVCGRGPGELGEEPHVHHIIPVSDFDDPNDAHTVENLRSLCREHHDHVEGWYLSPEAM